VFDALLTVSIFVVPWWTVLGLGALGAITFRWFFEWVGVMLVIESIFSAFWFPSLAVLALALLLVVELVSYYSLN
jgi:hypothetical protein